MVRYKASYQQILSDMILSSGDFNICGIHGALPQCLDPQLNAESQLACQMLMGTANTL